MTMTRSLILIVLAFTCFSCTIEETKTKREVSARNRRVQPEVTESNYLSGKQFCQVYSKFTKSEQGRYVSVPKDYNDLSKGNIEIYAWTQKPFNPNLPTFVHVNGGPGQNSHGMAEPVVDGWNEIYFDQRGLGCSAPPTFKDYKEMLYSTESTVKDMEAIRRAFGISKWTVYGISYGTIPATQYGSKYPESTKAVVLEGIFHSIRDMHSHDWKVDKLNQVLDSLPRSKQVGFANLLQGEHAQTMALLIDIFFYDEGGYSTLKFVLDNLIHGENSYNQAYLQQIKQVVNADNYDSPYPQIPSGIDQQVHGTIYCRELGALRINSDWDYNFQTMRFYVYEEPQGYREEFCSNFNINYNNEDLFVAAKFPIKAPVMYLQGSHDSATLARGAILHWKEVPRGPSKFLIKVKGGHNPMRSALNNNENKQLQSEHAKLYSKLLAGADIKSSDLVSTNNLLGDNRWYLYTNPHSDKLDHHLEGIKQSRAIGF